MYSNKFGRLTLGLCRRKVNTLCNVVASPAGRSGLSWTAAWTDRTRRSGGPELQQQVLPWKIRARMASQMTVDPSEVKRFQSLANKWWDERGEFAALHAMNDLRVPFIRDNLLNVHKGRQPGKPLAGLKILDVGCGGGLLTEPLGRLGADVLGIDPVADSISTAQLHLSHDPDLQDRVCYRTCALEELSGEGEEQAAGPFDAVVASEVVEHLADLETFAFCCNQVLKPGGSLFITTINKTNLSYALAIVAAERLLRIVPSGTHEWEKFISPVELERLLESSGLSVQSVRGMLYNPLSGSWSWTSSTAVNYALHAVKPREDPQPEWDESSSPHPDSHAPSMGTHN